jgi:methionine-rich copper-binding protein CopC
VTTGLALVPRDRFVRRPITLTSRLLASLAAVSLLLLLAGPVAAHAEFVSSDPSDGAVLDTPPTSVTLTFSEGLDASKSKFQLLAPDGSLVGTGTAAADGDETMSLGGLDLAPGAYLIKWTSVSLDTDILRGELQFTVAAASSTPATPAPAASAASPPATTAGGAAASAEPTMEPIAVPASAAPSMTPGTDAQTTSASNGLGDVLLPIVVVLIVVGAVGIYLLRRSRSA